MALDLPPLFSVVIPTQGRASIRDAVASVLEQSVPNFELIIVTDGDSEQADRQLTSVSDPRVRRISQPSSGVCAARNLGVSQTTGLWVTFLDDDDTARPDWLATWLTGTRREIVALTANLAYHDGASTREIDCRLNPTDNTVDASLLLAGGFALKRELFDSVGGYDERLRYYENFDLGLRLCERLAAAPPGSVRHMEKVVADIHVEATGARIDRYGSARGEAAALILERHAARFAENPRSEAGFLRILSRSRRLERDRRGACRAAIKACRRDWRDPKNWKAMAASLLPSLEHPARLIMSAFAREP